MGISTSFLGYSDKKTEDAVFYLRMIAMPEVKGNRTFFSKCGFSDLETRRFVFCSLIVNLSGALTVVQAKYPFKSGQIGPKLFNEFCQRFKTSPSNLCLENFIVYQPELEKIIKAHEIPKDYQTSEQSLFQITWKDRFDFFYRNLYRMPDVGGEPNVTFPDENIELFSEPPQSGDYYKKQFLDYFFLRFIGKESEQVPDLSSLVWGHIHKNLVAIREYIVWK